jgi:hypothetical protein
MQRIFQVPIAKPSSWLPPYVEENSEDSDYPLEFGLCKDAEGADCYYYSCRGCLSAGVEIDDLFKTSSAPESAWPYGDEGVPISLAHEMFAHGRQHEILWRWAVNRIPPPKYDR